MLYAFMAVIAALLFVRLQQVNYQQKQQEKIAPKDYMMAAGDLVGSPLAAALDPRVDQQTIDTQMKAERYNAPVDKSDPAQLELDLATPVMTPENVTKPVD